MKFYKILCIISGFAIIITGIGILAAAQPTSMPHVVFGTVSDADGNAMANITVRVINERTSESISARTNYDGHYQTDLSAMPSGYQPGDTIKVEAESGAMSGNAEVSVSTGPNDQCNLVLEEENGIPFPAFVSLVFLISILALIAVHYRRK